MDKVLLSIPPTNVSKLLNQLKLPDEYNTILNIHFKINLKDINLFDYPIVGFINTISQWIFIKKDHISVTVSDANILNSVDANVIVKDVWTEICLYLNKKIHYESFQIVREKKATYIQSPINRNLIKKLKNTPDNLILSGDWTQYNLPCTIEASILSGKNASNLT